MTLNFINAMMYIERKIKMKRDIRYNKERKQLEWYVKDELIKSIGVCNYNKDSIAEWNQMLDEEFEYLKRELAMEFGL